LSCWGNQKAGARVRRGIALGFQAIPDLLTEVDSLLTRGFQALKLRLGETPEKDIARGRAVREHVGEQVSILADVNTAYDLEQIDEILPPHEHCEVSWLEKPFAAHHYRNYIAAISKPICLNSTPLAVSSVHQGLRNSKRGPSRLLHARGLAPSRRLAVRLLNHHQGTHSTASLICL
jgi:L-alanine-DL-glutamate epimerase-like enolase superfamily enzyme